MPIRGRNIGGNIYLIVNELDVRPVDLFPFVLGLLHFKHVLIEVLLQLLIGQVDAELLKIVVFELLESCNRTDSDLASPVGPPILLSIEEAH